MNPPGRSRRTSSPARPPARGAARPPSCRSMCCAGCLLTAPARPTWTCRIMPRSKSVRTISRWTAGCVSTGRSSRAITSSSTNTPAWAGAACNGATGWRSRTDGCTAVSPTARLAPTRTPCTSSCPTRAPGITSRSRSGAACRRADSSTWMACRRAVSIPPRTRVRSPTASPSAWPRPSMPCSPGRGRVAWMKSRCSTARSRRRKSRRSSRRVATGNSNRTARRRRATRSVSTPA